MGLLSREISINYKGHEIVLTFGATGEGFRTDTLKLYIDGKLVDENTISGWAYLTGPTLVLRGQIVSEKQNPKPKIVKAIAKLRALLGHEYTIYIDDLEIHRQKGTIGGAY